jgi:cytochrome P450
MLKRTLEFVTRYEAGGMTDIARDMTMLTYDILAETLFSGEIAGEQGSFARQVDHLFETMGRVDPLDLLRAPEWLPRLTRIRGRKTMAYFRNIVAETVRMREERLKRDPGGVPQDFLTLLLKAEGPDGLTRAEVEDNIITFIGAGHETTARALGWAIYLLSQAPEERALLEAELDAFDFDDPTPATWSERLPQTRAVFEEAMRLYPPAPSLNRMAIEDDAVDGKPIPKGAAVLILPWILHRHQKLWSRPGEFVPDRFLPGKREAIDRYQYLPFGIGPRVCIGQYFAMQEGVIALAVLLKALRFD